MSNLIMFFVAPYTILIFMMSLLLYAVVGFHSVVDVIVFAPVALLAMSSGLDLCRISMHKLTSRFQGLNHREIWPRALILLGLALVPLPITAVLYLGFLIAPAHMGIVVGLGSAYKTGVGLALVVGLLKLAGISLSLRTTVSRFCESIEQDIYDEGRRNPLPPLPRDPNRNGGTENNPDRDDHLSSRNW